MKPGHLVFTWILLLVTANLVSAEINIEVTNVYVFTAEKPVKNNYAIAGQQAYVGMSIFYTSNNVANAKKFTCKWKLNADIPGKKMPKKLVAGKFSKRYAVPGMLIEWSTDITDKLNKKLASKKIANAFTNNKLACALEVKVSVSVKGQKKLKMIVDPLDVTVYGQDPFGEMIQIFGGSFDMGDTFGEGGAAEVDVHSVFVSEFYIDKYEVTKEKWDPVYNWAVTNGYSFDKPGSSKGTNHPVHTVTWYDTVKWCNARSEKDGRTPCYYMDSLKTTVYRTGQVDVANGWVNWDADGYRLPTEAEWEKAARGGAAGHRFPWSHTEMITHSNANYQSYWTGGSPYYPYDKSSTEGFHPDYDTDPKPYTSPVGSFAPNGYGVYDMAGNVREWCWDWHGYSYYSSSPGTDPPGPDSGTERVYRSGSWHDHAPSVRSACRRYEPPYKALFYHGFRCVCR